MTGPLPPERSPGLCRDDALGLPVRGDAGFVIDPHGHLTSHNHADIAQLIEGFGVSASGVIGGAAAIVCGSEQGKRI